MKYTRAQLLEYERLCKEWCEARKVADAAAMAILYDELDGKRIDPARRDEVARLDMEARRLMIAALRASPI